MLENKSLGNGIDVINAGGFEKGQMQAVVAKDSDWLIEKLQGIQTAADFFKNKPGMVRKTKAGLVAISVPSGFEHKCRCGFTALRFNGLLKQKCKKGKRRKYPPIVKSNFNLWR